jgi:hypothetical protein
MKQRAIQYQSYDFTSQITRACKQLVSERRKLVFPK